jgi:hypothetical protein
MIFDFLGTRVALDGEAAAARAALGFDFAAFPRTDAGPVDVRVTLHAEEPPWGAVPESARTVMVQPHCVVYQAGDRWVDYQGAALTRFDARTETADIWSRDPERLHEIAYLLVLSRVGELHDRRGLHRVHALGLAVEERGVLCLLPSGGGKTSLGMTALSRGWARLLSDDTPLLDRRGDLHGFPNRIGIAGPAPSGIAAEHLRPFPRAGRDPKTLVSVAPFPLAAHAHPAAVVLGERRPSGRARLERLSRAAAAPELFRSVVVGLGLPQVVEYFLRFDAADLAAKAAIVASRAAACAALLRRAPVHRLLLGRDREENAQVLRELLR